MRTLPLRSGDLAAYQQRLARLQPAGASAVPSAVPPAVPSAVRPAVPSRPIPFVQVVVDAFDPSVLVSDCATHVLDFTSLKEDELHDIMIPLNLTVGESAAEHACSMF